jgi:uncharacterized protein YjbI with pentapeptide repeats
MSTRWWWVIGIAGAAALFGLIIVGYWVPWTGFDGPPTKTLWDWLQLLVIPLVLAIGGFLFNQTQQRREQAIADEDRQEAALQSYLDRMAELLVVHKISTSKPEAPERDVARARTLTVLRRLGTDGSRKAGVLQFLYESGLIQAPDPIISLAGAELTLIQWVSANLVWANLGGAHLGGAHLGGANLVGANLGGADLGGADLGGAHLGGAHLGGAYLGGADLRGADLRGAYLERANLRGANLGGADLGGAHLVGANLGGANLGGADLGGANLGGANLEGARRLEPEQVKKAEGWQSANYDGNFRKALDSSLPPPPLPPAPAPTAAQSVTPPPPAPAQPPLTPQTAPDPAAPAQLLATPDPPTAPTK